VKISAEEFEVIRSKVIEIWPKDLDESTQDEVIASIARKFSEKTEPVRSLPGWAFKMAGQAIRDAQRARARKRRKFMGGLGHGSTTDQFDALLGSEHHTARQRHSDDEKAYVKADGPIEDLIPWCAHDAPVNSWAMANFWHRVEIISFGLFIEAFRTRTVGQDWPEPYAGSIDVHPRILKQWRLELHAAAAAGNIRSTLVQLWAKPSWLGRAPSVPELAHISLMLGNRPGIEIVAGKTSPRDAHRAEYQLVKKAHQRLQQRRARLAA
jgi:hypothetical protein